MCSKKCFKYSLDIPFITGKIYLNLRIIRIPKNMHSYDNYFIVYNKIVLNYVKSSIDYILRIPTYKKEPICLIK